jgi:hypothetical protein
VSLTAAGVTGALGSPGAAAAPASASAGVQALMKPFGHLDAQAASLSEKAAQFVASGNTMTPGDMIMMTVCSHEFMFQCPLTSNAANRTSDGLQPRFRQQA